VSTQRTSLERPWLGSRSAAGSVELEVIQAQSEASSGTNYVDRYHYLGYRQPFGCHLRYFIVSPAGVLGCVLLAGAAKALAARDQWIGWDRRCRQQNLPWGEINNTRLLIFPWGTGPPPGRQVAGATGPAGAAGLASALGL